MCHEISLGQSNEEDGFFEVFDWATAKQGDFERWLLNNEKTFLHADVCRLLASWSAGGESTASFNIAELIVNPKDGRIAHLLIKHPESGLDLRVGIEYSRSAFSENLPLVIRMALAFEGDINHLWSEVSRGEAETLRGKDWKYLSLRKEIQIDNKTFSFIYECENGKTYQEELLRSLSSRNKTSNEN